MHIQRTKNEGQRRTGSGTPLISINPIVSVASLLQLISCRTRMLHTIRQDVMRLEDACEPAQVLGSHGKALILAAGVGKARRRRWTRGTRHCTALDPSGFLNQLRQRSRDGSVRLMKIQKSVLVQIKLLHLDTTTRKDIRPRRRFLERRFAMRATSVKGDTFDRHGYHAPPIRRRAKVALQLLDHCQLVALCGHAAGAAQR